MKAGGPKARVVIRGAGEMAYGVIHGLFVEGYEPVALEQPTPCCVRRYVCFAEAVYNGDIEIEGVTGKLARDYDEAVTMAKSNMVPVLIDPQAEFLRFYRPDILIDGRMLKKDIDVSIDMAGLAIGLGPGFFPGKNCHCAIETNRGPNLGNVLTDESPQEDTAVPAPVGGYTTERLLRSPVDGVLKCKNDIGDLVKKNDILAEVNGMPVISAIDGVLRGICRDGIAVMKDQKIGDIDPRGNKELCFRLSEKAQAIANGAVRAIEHYAISKARL